MTDLFFERPILNSPYDQPARHWELDESGPEPSNLIVEIKGYRGEDAKEKANAMRAYRVLGMNNPGRFGRWAFAEFIEVFEIDAAFAELVDKIVRAAAVDAAKWLANAGGTAPGLEHIPRQQRTA